jgi:hypothetical protein
VVTAEGDFREHTVDVVPDGRLRLRADTLGTRDDTVKFLGARSRQAFPLDDGLCVAATLDWNEQRNGSYLSAALVLAEEETAGNPMNGRSSWVAVEFVGVPPGRNARRIVSESSEGRRVTLENEGWPRKNREGREIGVVRMVIKMRRQGLEVWENGVRRYASRSFEAPFARAFLHLQISSHSNYPAREIYFDDVHVNDCGGNVVEHFVRDAEIGWSSLPGTRRRSIPSWPWIGFASKGRLTTLSDGDVGYWRQNGRLRVQPE